MRDFKVCEEGGGGIGQEDTVGKMPDWWMSEVVVWLGWVSNVERGLWSRRVKGGDGSALSKGSYFSRAHNL